MPDINIPSLLLGFLVGVPAALAVVYVLQCIVGIGRHKWPRPPRG